MTYLFAHCPMLGCNHRNVICALPSDEVPRFEPEVYVAVKCANCGQVFRELAHRLEQGEAVTEEPPVEQERK